MVDPEARPELKNDFVAGNAFSSLGHIAPEIGVHFGEMWAVALQARFAMQKLFSVSKGAFRPPPKVESAVVRLAPLPAMLEIDADLLRQAFSARRKQLRNALPDIDLAALGLDPKLRPENLTPQDYARITAFTKSG